jgi:hypothetical protein
MKLGRGTKRILGALAALLLLFVLLHTGPAKWVARRLLASILGRLVEGQVTIEVLDYRLWRGELEIDGIAAAPDDGTYRLAARHVRLQMTGLPKFSLEIVEPELTVLRLPEGSAEAGSRAPLAFLRYLGASRIENGAFELLDSMRFEDVEADLLESSEGHRLALHAARGRALVSGEPVELGPLDADAVVAASGRASLQNNKVRVEARLRSEHGLRRRASLRESIRRLTYD